ncbi:MAG: hypothetical protein WA051_01050 [Minisyncoccia bacterium]
MRYEYPILNRVFHHFNDKEHDVSGTFLVCCQHLLEPQLKMFEFFIKFGFDPKKIFVLGKAYSTNIEVFNELKSLGINVFQPEFTGKAFDVEHRENCEEILKKIPENTKVIILDDGAELIKTFYDKGTPILFSVEQTSSGFRKLEGENVSFPIFNVARSSTKLNHESPFIARQGFERLKDYFINKGINDPLVLIVGLGPIGEAISEIFLQNNFRTMGFDIKKGHTDLINFIISKNPDLIIGCTGTNILSKDDVEKISISKKMYLVSASSSDREFPAAYFRVGTNIHDDVEYKNVTFLNNGFPITFKGNRNENTPFEMEKTIALLMGSVLNGAINQELPPGFIDVSRNLEEIINS